MATKNRCSSFICSSSVSSSSSSASCSSISASLIRKNGVATTSSVSGKVSINGTKLTKKRPPLGNITNQSNPDQNVCRNSAAVCVMANVAKTRKGFIVCKHGSTTSRSLPPSIPQTKPLFKEALFPKAMDMGPSAPTIVSISASASTVMDSIMTVSPSVSDGMSVSLDETMSTSGSMKSPDVEYMDNEGPPSSVSDRKIFGKLSISSSYEEPTHGDYSFKDPQWCASISFDIYKRLRASEVKKRPCEEYMERIQKDINASMRAVLIDWLVEVADEYRLVSDTLYLAVNYMDRYLSGNSINRTHLQLLGVTCVMIAAKYEEICAPQVDEFCYITDNTYCRDQVLRMESSVLNYLKFEMTATTIKCFLRHFVRVAQNSCEGPPTLLKMEFLASYIAELALLDYTMLTFPPSLTAASSVFLALFIISPSNNPWNRALEGYTQYRPSDMCDCVSMLHQLYCKSPDSSLPAIREKYSQHKYKFVAMIECPRSIPSFFFKDMNV